VFLYNLYKAGHRAKAIVYIYTFKTTISRLPKMLCTTHSHEPSQNCNKSFEAKKETSAQELFKASYVITQGAY